MRCGKGEGAELGLGVPRRATGYSLTAIGYFHRTRNLIKSHTISTLFALVLALGMTLAGALSATTGHFDISWPPD